MKKILLIIISNLFMFGAVMAQWQQANGPFGGCVITLEIDLNTHDLYAGTYSGGVFKSSDNGNSWTSINSGISNSGLFVKDIIVSTSNIFIGTYYDGIFLSTNNGNSWTAVNNGLTNKNVNSLAVNGTNIFAGTGGGVFLSTNNGDTWTAMNNGLTNTSVRSIAISGSYIFAGTDDGVFLSTDNGGNWTAVNGGLSGISVFCIAISGSNIFAGTNSNGIFISNNNGSSWTPVNTGLSGTNIHSIVISGSNVYAGIYNGGVCLSTNNGNTWAPINTGLSDLNVQSVVINGGNIFTATTLGVFLSTNNGNYWYSVNNGLSNTGVQSIAVDADNIFTGTWEGGVSFSNNSGTSWNSSNSGLSAKDSWGWHLNTFTINGSNVFAGTDVGIFFSNNYGNSWASISNGLSGYGLNVRTICLSGSNIFAGTWGGGIYLSTNNGSTWTAINAGLPVGFLAIRSILISGNNIFAGTNANGIFLSTNNGNSWNPVNTGLSGNGLVVSSLANIGSNIFAGTGDGIFLSANNGGTWTHVNTGLSDSWIESLVIYGNNILVRTGSQDVFLSRDDGNSWNDTFFSQISNSSNGTGPTSVFTYPIGLNGSYIFSGTSGNGVWKRSLSDFKSLSISTASITISAPVNSTKTFDITSNTAWSVSSNQTWLSPSSTTGTGNTTITLTAQANPTSSPRIASITISGTGVSTQTIAVTQDGSPSNCGIVTDVDGNTYNTVTIGTQCWLKENLKTTRYSDGTSIQLVNSIVTWDPLTNSSKAYCWYNDNFSNKDIYGALYTWTAAMNGADTSSIIPSGVQGVCPTGWHLPSWNEWHGMFKYIDPALNQYESSIAGGPMKETGTTHWNSPNTGATNASGFTALPGGGRGGDGVFLALGSNGIWWSTTRYGSGEYARNVSVDNNSTNTYMYSTPWDCGISVRCVRNELLSLASISSSAISDIASNTASGGGNITSDGGATVTARGVCWSTSANPTISDNKTTDGTGTGAFSSTITGLTPATAYHVRAYATNSVGTTYGNDISFTTSAITMVATLTGSGDACFGNASSIRSVITGGTPPYTITYTKNGATQTPNAAYTSGSDIMLGILSAGVNIFTIASIVDNMGITLPTGGLPPPYTITIKQIPDATASVLNKPLLCSDSLLKITLYSTINNTVFNYTVAADPIGFPVESNGSVTDSDGDGKEILTRYVPNNFLNTPATVTYTITPYASGCSGTPINREVKIEPRVLIPPYPIDTVCNNMLSMINVNTTTTSVNGIKYNWTVSTPAGVCCAINGPAGGTSFTTDIYNNSHSTINQTFTNPTFLLQKVAYTITGYTLTEDGKLGCPGIPWNAELNIEPDLQLDFSPNQTICSGDIAMIFVSTPYMKPQKVRYTWRVVSTGGITGATDGPINPVDYLKIGQPVTQVLINNTPLAQKVVYEFRGYIITNNGMFCMSGPLFIKEVWVNPSAQVNIPPNQVVCNGSMTTPINFTTVNPMGMTNYTWNYSGPFIGLPYNGVGNILSFNAINPGTSPLTATINVTPTLINGATCTGPTGHFTITVKQAPAINSINNTLCSGSPFSIVPANGLNGVVPPGTTYSWAIPVMTGGMMGGTTGGGMSSISGTLTNPTNSPQTATYIVTPMVAGCAGQTFAVVVTVLPKPIIPNLNSNMCSGASFTVIPVNGVNGIVPTGTIYSWPAPSVTGGLTGGMASGGMASISGTLINSTFVPQTATYIVTPMAAGCPGLTFSVVVTILPKPMINNMTATICSGTTFTVTPANGSDGVVPTPTLYSWPAPVVTGGITGGAAHPPSPSISGTLSNPTNSIQTATYTITPISGSCSGTPFIVTVTVNPTAQVIPSTTTQTICNDDRTTILLNSPSTFESGVITFNYTVVATGGVTGFATPVNGLPNDYVITDVLHNPTDSPQTLTYTIVPISPTGCTTGPVKSVVITVNPTPLVVPSTLTQTICNDGTTNVILGGPTTFTSGMITFNYTVVATGGVTGFLTPVNGLPNNYVITDVLHNPTDFPQTLTYKIVPVSPTGCSAGPVKTVVITVDPTPQVLPSTLTQTICNDGITNILLNSPINFESGVITFNYTVVATGGVVGFTTPVTGLPNNYDITDVLHNPTGVPQIVTYRITPISPGGCAAGPMKVVVITVNPMPALTSSQAPPSICSNSVFSYTPASSIAGTIFNWTRASVAGITPAGPASGSGSINEMLINTTNTPITVRYGYILSANGCSNPSVFNVDVLVYPKPVVIITNPFAICLPGSTDLTATAVTVGSSTGLVFTYWTDAAATIPHATPATASPGLYYIKGTALSGCFDIKPVTVTGNPKPVANAGGSQTICSGGSATVNGASSSFGNILWTSNGAGTLTNLTTLAPTYSSVTADAGRTIILTMTVTSNNACFPQNVSATYTVSVKENQTIIFDPLSDQVYGDNPILLEAHASSSLAVNYASSNPLVATVTGNAITIIGAGTTTIYANQPGNANYCAAPVVSQVLKVSAKPITVKANPLQSKIFGDIDPVFTYSVSPSMTGPDRLTGTLSRTPGESIGNSYVITRGTLDAGPNYIITYLPDYFTITAGIITVTVDKFQSKVFGQPDPVFTYTVSPASFPLGSLTGSLSRLPGEDAGSSYLISQGTLSSTHNTIVFVTENFTITPKPVTVTANSSQSKVYGEADPVLSFTVSPSLIGTDEFSGYLSRIAGENAGTTYPITLGTLNAGSNYTITLIPANFSISPKPITVSILPSQSKFYGDTDPVFQYSFVPEMIGLDGFTGKPERTPGENVGVSYKISQGTLSAGPNYKIIFVSGYFKINPKQIELRVTRNQSKVYGSLDPKLMYSYSPELIGNDVITGSLTRLPGENTGSYPVQLGTVVLGRNYTIIFVPANFTVSKAPLTITADSKERHYLDENPEFTLSFSGFVNGENKSVLDVLPTATSIASSKDNAGTYSIEVSGGSDNNYSYIYKTGILTVLKSDQFITFNEIPDKLRISQTYELVASASSGLPVSFESSDLKKAVISENIMLVNKEGRNTIIAKQEGNINWNPAPDVSNSYIGQPSFDNITSLFTPNEDGVNDYWYIPNIEDFGRIQVKVYNRFGKLVYESSDYKNDWNGTFNGSPLPSASYYYIIKSSEKGVINGVVNIVR